MTPVPPPPNSPDLTQGTFFVSRMKSVLKGKQFAHVEEVKQKPAEALKGFKIHKFKNCFEWWKNCLDRCIDSNGEYLEGDQS